MSKLNACLLLQCNLFFLSYLQQWGKAFISSFAATSSIWKHVSRTTLKQAQSYILPSLSLLFSGYLQLLHIFMKCSAYSWIPSSKKGFLLPHEEGGPRHVSYRLHSCSYIPQHFYFFFSGTGCSWIMFSWWLAVTPWELFCTSPTPAACPVPSCICSADYCFCWSVQIRISQINFWIYWITF